MPNSCPSQNEKKIQVDGSSREKKSKCQLTQVKVNADVCRQNVHVACGADNYYALGGLFL